jgi:hypothetical protein
MRAVFDSFTIFMVDRASFQVTAASNKAVEEFGQHGSSIPPPGPDSFRWIRTPPLPKPGPALP